MISHSAVENPAQVEALYNSEAVNPVTVLLLVMISHSAVENPAKAEALCNSEAGQPSDFALDHWNDEQRNTRAAMHASKNSSYASKRRTAAALIAMRPAPNPMVAAFIASVAELNRIAAVISFTRGVQHPIAAAFIASDADQNGNGAPQGGNAAARDRT